MVMAGVNYGRYGVIVEVVGGSARVRLDDGIVTRAISCANLALLENKELRDAAKREPKK